LSHERSLKIREIQRRKAGFFDWKSDPKYKKFDKIEQIDLKYSFVFRYLEKNILFDEGTFFTHYAALQTDDNLIKRLNVPNIGLMPLYIDFAKHLITNSVLKDKTFSRIIAENISNDESQMADLEEYLRFLYANKDAAENRVDLFKIDKDIVEALEDVKSLINRYIGQNFKIVLAVESFISKNFGKERDITQTIRAALDLGILDKTSKYYWYIQKVRRRNLYTFVVFDKLNREITQFFFKNGEYVKVELFDNELFEWIKKVNVNLLLKDEVKFEREGKMIEPGEKLYEISMKEEDSILQIKGGLLTEIFDKTDEIDDIYEEEDENKVINFAKMDLFEVEDGPDEFEEFQRSLKEKKAIPDITANVQDDASDDKNGIENKEEPQPEMIEQPVIGQGLYSRIQLLDEELINLFNNSKNEIAIFINDINKITPGGISEIDSLAVELEEEFKKIKDIYEIFLSVAEQLQ
jgi:hypothetical protein